MSKRKLPYPERFGGAALVTGASSGIGRVFAQKLAQNGMDLILVARREQRLLELKTELCKQYAISVLTVSQDLAEASASDSIHRACQEAQMEVGLLIHCAGFGYRGPFEDHDPAAAAGMVDVNCRAQVALSYAYLPAMLARGRGGLIFVASIAGFQPTPYFSTYGATKAFDLMLAEALWSEYRSRGIEVLALCPGYTPTEFQAVAGSDRGNLRAPVTSSEQVVACALRSLGKKPSVIPGARNKLLSWSVRLVPRSTTARLSAKYSKPTNRKS